jgi:hypothetical protein
MERRLTSRTALHRLAAIIIKAGIMIGDSRLRLRVSSLSPKSASMDVWHVRTVIMPRRSITGRLLFGQVWRRRDGRHWIYKKFAPRK